jgi:post-segregation antitoxin (ccd killing protein)
LNESRRLARARCGGITTAISIHRLRERGSILSNLRLGGIIAEIDGKPTEEFFQENRENLSDSNEHSERADLFPKLI